MTRNWLRFGPVSALLAALVLAACTDQSGSTDQLLGPQEAALSKGGGWKARYQVLTSFTASSSTSSVKLVGASGDTLQAGAFLLTIPPGAVNRSTRFEMKVLSNGTYGVDLTATRTDWRGNVVDVGRQGFKKPLLLALSYGSVASSIPAGAELSVVWLKDAKTVVPVAGYVDVQQQAVFGWLQHFSEYGVGWPNRDEGGEW